MSQAQYAQNYREELRFNDRELRILRDIAAGATNEEVAARLGLSAHTVAGHLRVMLSRSQARNRAELVARGYATGLLVPGVWPPLLSGQRCLGVPLNRGRRSLHGAEHGRPSQIPRK